MSSHTRSKLHEMNRSKDELSSYRSSSYASKSKSEVDSRKRSSYSSRESGRAEISSKHKDLSYIPKSSISRSSLDDRKDDYIHSRERREVPPKRNRDEYISNSSRDLYSKRVREKEYFETKERDPYTSKAREYYPSSRGRVSYSSRGSGSFSSRGSGTFSSRGSGTFSSRGSGTFSSRGNGTFMSRGRPIGAFSSRGSREAYPAHETFGSSRGSYGPVRGGSYGSVKVVRTSYSSRGGYGLPQGRRELLSGRGRDFSMRGSRGLRSQNFRDSLRGRSDNFMPQASMVPRSKLEFPKKSVASVLQDSDFHGRYRDEKQYRIREFKRDGREFYRESSDRPYKEVKRPVTHSSAYNQSEKMISNTTRLRPSSVHNDKERFFYSERPKMKVRDKFRGEATKRTHHHDEHDSHSDIDHDLGPPPKKHKRLERADKYRKSETDKDSRSRSPKRKLKGEVVKGKAEEKVKEKKKSSRHAKKRESKSSDKDDEEEEEPEKKVNVKRRLTREDEEEEDEEEYAERKKYVRRERKTSPSGMQVTIRSDGERAVNSDGHVKSRITGKIFVDLQCPHCPGKRSVTFKEYRYHLDSRGHKMKIENLQYKHSVVLRRIRLQQRTELKETEEKWQKENPDEFQTTISRYCTLCKLAYKCLPEDNSSKGIAEHNESKLHVVLQRYLRPRCVMCRMAFPSRLVYEYHIASIRHLRMRTMCQENGREGSNDGEQLDEGHKGEDVDFTNFITMDSVGEDQQEELGSETDEIKGKLEDIEKAEVDAKEGEEEEGEEQEEEQQGVLETSSTVAEEEEAVGEASSFVGEDEELFEVEMEDEYDHEENEEEQKEEQETEPCGKDYIVAIEAVYCKLCRKAIRTDTAIGEKAINRHCVSAEHFHNYDYLASGTYMEEDGEGEEENLNEEEMEHVDENEEAEESLEAKQEGEEHLEEDEEQFERDEEHFEQGEQDEQHLGDLEQESVNDEAQDIEEAEENGE